MGYEKDMAARLRSFCNANSLALGPKEVGGNACSKGTMQLIFELVSISLA